MMLSSPAIDLRLRKNFLLIAIPIAISLTVFIFTYQMNGQPLSLQLNTSEAKGIPSLAAVPSTEKTPILEVHIANNGSVFLKGATVVSISEDSLRVTTAWDAVDLTWEVQTNFYTKFLKSRSEEQAFEDIQLGDVVNVTGELISGGTEPVINAQFIRE